jgi:predicted permease
MMDAIGWLTRFGRRMLMLLRHGQFDADLEEEMRLHQELREQEQVERGVSPEEARYASRRRFGNKLVLREESRDIWGWNWLDNLLQDVRYGLRQLRRNPGFTAVAVITLALGIGATTAIFSAIDTVLLHPYSFPDPGRVVSVWSSDLRTHTYDEVSGADYLDWKSQNDVFRDMAAYSFREPADFSAGVQNRRVWSIVATASLLPTLGIRPALGRTFLSQGEATESTGVLLGYHLWQSYFGARRSALGRTVRVNGRAYEVIGVLPPHFDLPAEGGKSPYVMLSATSDLKMLSERSASSFFVIARLKARRSLDAAQSDMTLIGKRLAAEYRSDRYRGVKLMPLGGRSRAFLRDPLWALFGAVIFVLLIACANVSSLLLGRGLARQKEFAIRTALGAAHTRLTRQLFVESLMLACCGGGLGFAIAWDGTSLIASMGQATIPALKHLRMSIGAVLFSAGLSFSTALLFGLFPAWRAGKIDVNASLKEAAHSATEGFRSFRARRVVVVAQVALACIVLCGATLLLRSLYDLVRTNPGFRVTHLISAEVSSSGSAAAEVMFYGRLLQRLGQVPGVAGVAAVSAPPMGSDAIAPMPSFQVLGRPAPKTLPAAMFRVATPGYFRVMGIRVISGREFGARDTTSSSRVAVINDRVARAYFPGRSAVGQEIALSPIHYTSPFAPRPGVLRIVGMIAGVKHWFTGTWPHEDFEIYVPYAQAPLQTMTVVARLEPDALNAAGRLRQKLSAMAPGGVVQPPETMEQQFRDTVAPNEFYPTLLTAFAALALGLASIGLYGTLAYLVRERTHEIAIRMALGAQKTRVLRLIGSQGMILALIGIGIGIAGGLGLMRLLSSLLYAVKPTDPLTFVLVSVVLICVALLACYIPARRAMNVDPMEALRYE